MNKEELKRKMIVAYEMQDMSSYHNYRYVLGLVEENERLKNTLNYIRSLDLYEYEPDYDYEENIVANYYPILIDDYIDKDLIRELDEVRGKE